MFGIRRKDHDSPILASGGPQSQKRSKIDLHQTQFFIVDCKDKSLGEIISVLCCIIDKPFQNIIFSQRNEFKFKEKFKRNLTCCYEQNLQ